MNSVKNSSEVTPLKKGKIKRNKHTDRHFLSYRDHGTHLTPRLDVSDGPRVRIKRHRQTDRHMAQESENKTLHTKVKTKCDKQTDRCSAEESEDKT